MLDYSEYNVDVEILKLEEEINLTKVAKMLVFFAIQERLKTQQHVSNETIKELQRAVSRRMMSAIEKDEFHYRVLPGKFLVDELPEDTGYNFDNAKAYYDDIISWASKGSMLVPAEYHPDSPANQQEQSDLNVSQERSEVIREQTKLKDFPTPEAPELVQEKAEGVYLAPKDSTADVKEPEPVQMEELEARPEAEKGSVDKKAKDNGGKKDNHEKDQEAVIRGKRTKHLTKEFNLKLTEIIVEYIPEYCNCNHRKIGEYIKSIWPDLHKQHFNNADLKSKYDLANDASYYIERVCRTIFKENYEEACRRLDEAETEEEKTAAKIDIDRWEVVKNKHSGPKICEVSDHNVF